jgi:hypothetical protein
MILNDGEWDMILEAVAENFGLATMLLFWGLATSDL